MGMTNTVPRRPRECPGFFTGTAFLQQGNYNGHPNLKFWMTTLDILQHWPLHKSPFQIGIYASPNRTQQNATELDRLTSEVKITDPAHPLFGRTFPLVQHSAASSRNQNI